MTTPVKRLPTKKSAPKKAPAKMGRPTLLNPEVEREFLANRALGLSLKRSCELAGVVFDTFANWCEVGKSALNKNAGNRTAHEQTCLEFFLKVTKVDSEWMKRCEIINALALTPGQSEAVWKKATNEERQLAAQTARWKLANQARDEYSTRTQTEHSGHVSIDEQQTDLVVRALEAALEAVPAKYHEKARTEMARVLRAE